MYEGAGEENLDEREGSLERGRTITTRHARSNKIEQNVTLCCLSSLCLSVVTCLFCLLVPGSDGGLF